MINNLINFLVTLLFWVIVGFLIYFTLDIGSKYYNDQKAFNKIEKIRKRKIKNIQKLIDNETLTCEEK